MKLMASKLDWTAALALWAIVPAAYLLQGQDANWDLQNYHLYNTISLFEGSFFSDTAPAGIQSYFNPLVSLPAYWIHRVADTPTSSMLAGLALSSFQGLCGPLLYAIARALLPGNRLMAVVASAFGLSSSILLSEAGTSFADLTLCVLQLSSVLLCIKSLCADSEKRLPLIVIAWGILGSACGIKFSAVFMLPILFALTFSSQDSGDDFHAEPGILARQAFWIVISLLIGFTAFGIPWFFRAWVDNGNPLFPLFSGLFGESRLFFADNHSDTRFAIREITKLLLSPFDDIRLQPNLRAEIAYRDLRTVAWVYPGIVSLLAVAIVRIYARLRRSLSIPLVIPCGWIPLQIGMLIGYAIWLIAAGIARYSLPFQALSGISLSISIAVIWQSVCKTANLLPCASATGRFSRHQLYACRAQRLTILLFLILGVCLSVQVTPSWGRADFGITWNSLSPLDGFQRSFRVSLPINEGELFPADKPIILMSQPLGWLKQYAPNKPSFHLINKNLRPLILQGIRADIRRSGGDFTVVDFVSDRQATLSQNTKIILAEGEFQFRTNYCSDYRSPTGLIVRICAANLLVDSKV